MPKFVPTGYLPISEALNHLGHELFPAAWTDEEHTARSGLISKAEWLKIKDLPPARGGGALGSEMLRGTKLPPVKPAPRSSSDPSDRLYQKEYNARQRYVEARHQLRQQLEAGQLEAAILDPWTGKLHPASNSIWRRTDVDRMIDQGQALIPGSRNAGSLLVKQFAEADTRKPLPTAKIQQAIGLLKQKIAAESLTRPEQADFLRESFPGYHLRDRQLTQIFRAVPAPTGRPRKSG